LIRFHASDQTAAVVPLEIVTKAAPDGYTLLVFGSAYWLLPFLQNVGYNPGSWRQRCSPTWL
jgi:hypothetical protein